MCGPHARSVLAFDLVPHTSQARKYDVLYSMAAVAGYRAVIEAAALFGRFFTGQVTMTGKVEPAQVLVIGASPAGLAAIGMARNLGAKVYAFDLRASIRAEVESLGATFLTVELPAAMATRRVGRAALHAVPCASRRRSH